jgi:predicted ATPase
MTTRISRIYFGDFQQFRDLELDFRGPDGTASNRICFIGRNGTGKSTLLNQLSRVVLHGGGGNLPTSVKVDLQRDGDTVQLTRDFMQPVNADVHAFWVPEYVRNSAMTLDFAPSTSLQNAITWGQKRQSGRSNPRHRSRENIHPDNASEVWHHLLFRTFERAKAREDFERQNDNLDKTKRELIEAFDSTHPDVLAGLVALWSRLLRPAGLEVDEDSLTAPVSLTENLEMRIRVRSSREQIRYRELSTGIRNFLFQVGHLWLLYFDRDVENGFVFIDEPENSLFPDFLFELMALLDEILGENTQLFVATHSPLVAAQFEPWQRILLDWNDDGTVSARKGTAPKGDDPNDVLTRDFELTEVMGPAGREAYRRYLTLRKQLRRAKESEKPALLEEAAEIGQAYGFE